jgi:hypothetical protein
VVHSPPVTVAGGKPYLHGNGNPMETLGTLAAIVGALGLVAILAAAILPDPDTERRRRIAERMERNRETSRNRRIGGGR